MAMFLSVNSGILGLLLLFLLGPGEQLDSRDVPKCQLAKTAGKGGNTNVFPRQLGPEVKSVGFGHWCWVLGGGCQKVFL